MEVKKARQFLQSELSSLYDSSEAEAISWRVLEHLTGFEKMKIWLNQSMDINDNELLNLCDQLKKNIPIQYVLGYEWWGGMKLKVNQRVLIPRPETEELAIIASQYIQTKVAQAIAVIDIGTGCGCLPIFIKKKNPFVNIDAMDISEEALNVAKENAKNEHVEIHFFQNDIFQNNIFQNRKYDIIVSNPPYILPEEKIDMHERVWANEPNVALFVTNHDPLQFYKAIAVFAMQFLKPDGKIFLEINQSFANEIVQYFQENHFLCEVKEDFYQNNRFAIVSFAS